MKIREAPFAIRVVRRREGEAAIIYRRQHTPQGRDRLTRLAGIGPLAYTTGLPLLRAAVRGQAGANGRTPKVAPGPWLALDADWGARVACYALVAEGLRDPERLGKAAGHLQRADGAEAAWWLGMMTSEGPAARRATRALRILTEAVT